MIERGFTPNPVPDEIADRRTIYIFGDGFLLRLPLGDGPPTITAGVGGGYELVPRPQGKSITEWKGSEPIQMEVPIALDRYGRRGTVERDFRRLLKLGRADDGAERPDPFKVTGPIPYSGERFVINGNPTFEQLIRRNLDGRHKRVMATLPLMEYVRGDRLRIRKQRRKMRFYTTKGRESIRNIVVKIYGDADRAREVAKLNGIRDVRKKLKPGTKIRLRKGKKKGGKEGKGR